jgi:diguanylate cyclase (GGDEF)-like protein
VVGMSEESTEPRYSSRDEMTGLDTRAVLVDRLRQSLSRARWTGRSAAVLFVDLDRFKNINDTLGHHAGDLVLTTSAERLRGCVRDGDTVARLGGDEFAIALIDLASADDVPRIVGKIREALAAPIVIDGKELFVNASIGVTLGPTDGDDPATLLRLADVAMYEAKKAGRNCYRLYSPAMNARAHELLELEMGLRRALERNELTLYFQPVIHLASRRIEALEALLRWKRRDKLVSAGEFVPLAEETGLIHPIGAWVLREACIQTRAWRDAGFAVRVACNVSGRQLQHGNLTALVDRTLHETNCAPDWLELELTESSLMRDTTETTETLQALRASGVRLSIDGFGTGYSSLSYLRTFPVDKLKIDQRLVQDEDDAGRTILQGILLIACGLGLETVAKGIETEAQLERVRTMGYEAGQGYALGRPLPVEDATARLAGTR